MIPPLMDFDALQLVLHYSSPVRVYHSTWHLFDVLRAWHALAVDRAWEHPVDAGLALAFHDAYYDPTSDRNEEVSAAMAEDAARRYHVDAGRVRDMVLATKRHTDVEVSDDPDTNLLLDVDLINLGRSYEWFAWSRQSIRLEYLHLSDADWRTGTSAFFERMLSKPRVFRRSDVTLPGSTEEQARRNLEQGLAEFR